MNKSSNQLNKLKSIQAGSQIIDQIFWELFAILKSKKQLTEKQIASFIKSSARKLGAEKMAFPPIVSFGKNAVEIHHKPTNQKVGMNNFLMLDFGVKVKGYCSDFTRTLFIGKPSSFQKKIYNIVLSSQIKAIKKISVGTLADEIDFAARHVINSSGFGKYYIHGTGHGVGKKIHERPSFKPNSGDVVKLYDIVTIEPGIYLPGKFGVRIEDMILVSSKTRLRQSYGGQALSKVPKDLESMIIS